MFVLLAVVLFIHIDCFGASCPVLGDIDSRDARLLSKYNGTTLNGIQLVSLRAPKTFKGQIDNIFVQTNHLKTRSNMHLQSLEKGAE